MSEPAGYLLDTNILSETRKKRPDPNLAAFLANHDTSLFYLSVLTLGELRKRTARRALTDPAGAAQLAEWIDSLERAFDGRILKVDARVARLWGELSSQRSTPVVDTLLAATAIVHNLTLATRNTRDMPASNVKLHNPFDP